jgi:hypothetical protein
MHAVKVAFVMADVMIPDLVAVKGLQGVKTACVTGD